MTMTLKSRDFRAAREASWRRLEQLVDRAQRRGVAALAPEEVQELPLLYRTTLSSLSVARSISLDRNLLHYLETLAVRAYLCVYGPREDFATIARTFLVQGFPAAVRTLWRHIAIAVAILACGVFAGWHLTALDPDWFGTFVPSGLAEGRGPASSTDELAQALHASSSLGAEFSVFAAFLFGHNGYISILTFALGFAYGVPTALLLLYNGLGIGAFCALYAGRGLFWDLFGWLSVHGTTELTAILLCGGAGFALGDALLFPGRQTRLDNLARRGPIAAEVAIGGVGLLLVAAFLEGFVRQLVDDTPTRFIIGAAMGGLWLVYFVFGGRRSAAGRHGG
jgi:uncharacterized membrane protein SpoIIM required for sporulation